MFQPFPLLETPRLTLRKLEDSDAADMFLMRSDPQVMQYIPRPLATCEADALNVIHLMNSLLATNERINWGMEWKETGMIIGTIGFVHMKPEHFRAEVGYCLNRDFHRRGIMREALQRVIRYGFETLRLHSIEAIIDADNHASGALLEASGFSREAFFREDFFYNGEFRNSVHYGLLQREWAAGC